MTRKTDGERVDDLQHRVGDLERSGTELTGRLEKLDAVLNRRADYAEQALAELSSKQGAAGDRLRELERVVAESHATLRLDHERQLAALRLEYERQLADLRRAHETEARLLKQQVDDIRQEMLRWGGRVWQAAAGVGVVVIGAAVCTYLGLRK